MLFHPLYSATTQVRSTIPISTCFARSITNRAVQHPLLASQRPSLNTMSSASLNQQAPNTGPGHPGASGYFPSFSTINFYAGSQINRLGWLRNDSKFLNAALALPQTKFILLQHLNPLVHTGEGEKSGQLATLSWKQVESTIRDSLALSLGGSSSSSEKSNSSGDIFGAEANLLPPSGGKEDEKHFTKVTEGLNPTSLALVFLGVDEGDINQNSLPGGLASTKDGVNTPAGTPYFALSLSHKPAHFKSSPSTQLPVEILEQDLLRDGQYDFVETRTLAQAGTWPLHDAAVVAQARSLIDWNERHQVSFASINV